MTATFVTEVQLGARGQGFSAPDIAHQEECVARCRSTLRIEEKNPLRWSEAATARVALLQGEDRLALMHMHNRLRELEGR